MWSYLDAGGWGEEVPGRLLLLSREGDAIGRGAHVFGGQPSLLSFPKGKYLEE